MKQNIIEIVTFKLNQGVSTEQMLEKSAAFEEFAAKQPGFLYRSLAHQADTDTFVDVSYWETLEDNKKMQAAFEEVDVCQAFCALVDKESVGISHHTVLTKSCDA
ncbi:antibiotic biosynthesis monooxygenase family protein [Pseudoalteromonas luteoviolacea]|uniref:ABM domain-containing protein n=1 Tax=Pseudoalteromonas luteoviolacea DSM 6061 TaxID=1365250 RepID=A0A166VWW0_9GAMM|nr:hypothetical protein [Pseudoalteromonas luteoviolacea]KZN34099.1 hypothetical protein N475_19280 [Pseudoalteromonas luteoviolacea DSM 6061]KZN52747.1 hypothetical protein N474_22520 [Pseudoalteromonas luteoviolacea CPMOR-2]MBE0389695.1 hypothetical protein [Pseudoalteromonas luteoviolacea DSM 6061]TQF67700.1 hypothetical protein FLM44_21205 [Pseudoalteromonas luteoviolacea]